MRALTNEELGFVSGGFLSPLVLDYRGTTTAECASFGRLNDDGGNRYSFTGTETTKPDGTVSVTITCTVIGANSNGGGDFCPDGMSGPACIRPGEGFFTYSGRALQNPFEVGGAILQGYIDGLVEAWRSVDWAQEIKDSLEDHLRGGMVRPSGNR